MIKRKHVVSQNSKNTEQRSTLNMDGVFQPKHHAINCSCREACWSPETLRHAAERASVVAGCTAWEPGSAWPAQTQDRVPPVTGGALQAPQHQGPEARLQRVLSQPHPAAELPGYWARSTRLPPASGAATPSRLSSCCFPQNLNFTGFRKILKKHDKILDTSRGADWRVAHVEVAPFYTCKKITQLISETEVAAHARTYGTNWSAPALNRRFCAFGCRRLSPPSWREEIVRGPWRGWGFLPWGQLRSARLVDL